MKKIVLLILTLISTINLYSQDSIVNYLDRKYKEVSKNEATYIQTIVKKDSLWQGTVYFGNGKVKLQGKFKNKRLKTRIGSFKVYNEKGSLKSIQNYNNKGRKDGFCFYFNDQGAQVTRGFFVNGKKEGLWKYSDDKGINRARVIFEKGKVLNYKLWDDQGDVLKEELILAKKPKFKGGVKSFKSKLKKVLIKDLKKARLKTNFLVKFNVDKAGKVGNITISPKLEEVYEKKIMEFFYNIKDVSPAIIANIKVDYLVEIPVILR